MSASKKLRFARDLYHADGIETARATYDDFATLLVEESEDAWIVTVTTDDSADYTADVIAGEFGNFALAETILRSR